MAALARLSRSDAPWVLRSQMKAVRGPRLAGRSSGRPLHAAVHKWQHYTHGISMAPEAQVPARSATLLIPCSQQPHPLRSAGHQSSRWEQNANTVCFPVASAAHQKSSSKRLSPMQPTKRSPGRYELDR